MIAGFYNANGGIDGRGVYYTDFHPEHSLDGETDGNAAEILISRAAVALNLQDVSPTNPEE